MIWLTAAAIYHRPMFGGFLRSVRTEDLHQAIWIADKCGLSVNFIDLLESFPMCREGESLSPPGGTGFDTTAPAGIGP